MVFAALVVAGPLQDNSDKEGQIEKRQRSVEDTYVDGEGMWVAFRFPFTVMRMQRLLQSIVPEGFQQYPYLPYRNKHMSGVVETPDLTRSEWVVD
ncbi:hypothetical protein N7450_003635 [Penicillium hetheringtonii]|uniref:Uncharacterized protein n=1 Tax=Penicillium hetheringtonii TaxID=911720 RepID=A0AAD6GZ83_9EURO|nr:hypothetical protein N7450_003635 [Penicillium hetheringtonii]